MHCPGLLWRAVGLEVLEIKRSGGFGIAPSAQTAAQIQGAPSSLFRTTKSDSAWSAPSFFKRPDHGWLGRHVLKFQAVDIQLGRLGEVFKSIQET